MRSLRRERGVFTSCAKFTRSEGSSAVAPALGPANDDGARAARAHDDDDGATVADGEQEHARRIGRSTEIVASDSDAAAMPLSRRVLCNRMHVFSFVRPLAADDMLSMVRGHDAPHRSQIEGRRVRFAYRAREGEDRADVLDARAKFRAMLESVGAGEIVDHEAHTLTDEWELAGRIEDSTENLRAADARSDTPEQRRWQNILTELATEAVELKKKRGDAKQLDVLENALREALDAGASGVGAVLSDAGWTLT
jgi:hypothetical protein